MTPKKKLIKITVEAVILDLKKYNIKLQYKYVRIKLNLFFFTLSK